jgi:serine protease Do
VSITNRANTRILAVETSVFGRLIRRYSEDRADLLAAVVTYSLLFSMFPIILGVLAIVGLVLRDPVAQARARDLVLSTVPSDSALSVLHAVSGASESAGVLGLLSIVGILWGGVSLFGALEAVFDRIYRVNPRPFLRQTLMAVAMMLLFALLVVAELAAITAAQLVGQFAQHLPLVGPDMAPAVVLAGGAVSLLAAFALCFAIYYVVPNVHLKASQVLPGTLFASLALVLLTQIFPLYALYLGGTNPYGAAIGLFFLLMTWAYLVANALLVGAEINALSRPSVVEIRHSARLWSLSALLVGAFLVVTLSACQVDGTPTGNTRSTQTGAVAPSPTLAAQSVAPKVAAAGSTVAPTTNPSGPVPTTALTSGTAAGLSVKEVARLVKPSIVQITNQTLVVDKLNRSVPETQGVGSGVIYDPKGLILTNNHVISGAQVITVSLPDGRSYPGKLLGGDPQMDLAIVAIEPKSGETLPVAKLGDSGKLEVGDQVVAIGNALALHGGPTVTSGVASALGRAIQEPGDGDVPGPYLYDLIQTDAAINPGNSGGALVNAAGEVIGINTLGAGGAPDSAPAQGISFAISINSARPIADQLASTGKATHAYLGVSTVALTPGIATQLNLSVKEGLILRQVGAGSPADKAGLKVRDVVTTVDGQKVGDETDLGQVLTKHKPGDKVKLEIVRGADRSTVEVQLGERASR